MPTLSKDLSDKIANLGLLCSFFVVFMHASANAPANSTIINILTRGGVFDIAVPFFFTASGFFLGRKMNEDHWWLHAIKSRIRSLLIPYLVWNILWVCFCADSSMTCIRIIHPLFLPPLSPLWYMKVLIGLVMISPLLKAFTHHHSGILVILTWLLLPFLAHLVSDPTISDVSYMWIGWLKGMTYFSAGLFLSATTPKATKSLATTSALIGTALCASRLFYAEYASALAWLSWPFLLISLFHFMPAITLPNWLTKAAFPIYLMHIFILTMLPTQDISYAPSALLTISICILLSYLIHKSSRVFSDILFGGR